jgi:threonylcarbamoyladenosine tRNA methylthiotransferase MtaB
MTKVALETVGCRLNQYETERIAAELIARGMERVGYDDYADLYILNSCTVTGRADADCRKLIRRAYRKNKKATIVVAGCYVEAYRRQAAGLEGVDLVLGNDEKRRTGQILFDKYPQLFDGKDYLRPPAHFNAGSDLFGDYSRAMVKIGDGCDQGCAYCIVPRVRGRFYSVPAGSIITEINRLVEGGYHEVVLTAVHVGRYRSDGLDLAGLVEKILNETDLSRIRLSSLEPNELGGRLITYVADHPRVCRHLHLPMQSGSDRILKLMRRPYMRKQYLSLIEDIKKRNEYITIGCDLIVGFPGETEGDFEQSLDILESGFIDYSHVFSYSDRPGTPASEMTNKVGPNTIKDRNLRAREAGHRRRSEHYRRHIGQILEVISENKAGKDGRFNATSDNYIKVKIPVEFGGNRQIIKFRPMRLSGRIPKTISLDGEIIA